MEPLHPIGPELRAHLAGLEGLIPEAVGLRLAVLAAEVPPERAIVELGSYRGRSTCYLAAGARAGMGAPVFAIDPWDSPGNATGRFRFADPGTRAAFTAAVRGAGLAASVTAFRAFSADLARFWTRPVGLLYVDGSHTEEDVRRDWHTWHPHLSPGAIVAWDDYRTARNPGVAAVVDRLRRTLPGTWEEGPAPLITVRLP